MKLTLASTRRTVRFTHSLAAAVLGFATFAAADEPHCPTPDGPGPDGRMVPTRNQAAWTEDEQAAYDRAVEFKRMLPVDILPIPAANPQLPVTGNSPFPIESLTQFRDQRSEDDRYLRHKPGNITSKTVTRGGRTYDVPVIDGTDIEVYVDHPFVQPRAQRSKHYRIFADNTAAVPHADDGYLNGEPKFLPRVEPRNNLFVTYVQTAPAMYPEVDPYLNPPGTNMLPTIYQNMRDRYGNEMFNTLPSHPSRPYNLHIDEPVVTRLDTMVSPSDDLRYITDNLFELVTDVPARRLWESLDTETLQSILDRTGDQHEANIQRRRKLLIKYCDWAIAMIEGDDRPGSAVPSNRVYRGFALLHHSGHKPLPYPDENGHRIRYGTGKLNRILPVFDEHGDIVAGHAEVHQIWYDGRIESDTMFFDFGWDDEFEEVADDDATPFPAGSRTLRKDAPQQQLYAPKLVTTDNGETIEQRQQRRRPARVPPDVPWTITYTIDVLNRGEDDFSPTQVYFDEVERIDDETGKNKAPFGRVLNVKRDLSSTTKLDNPHPELNTLFEKDSKPVEGLVPIRFGPPHVAMDQTFFPLHEGTRTKLTIKMAPPKNTNVTYTWGWRNHPPRAQAVENSHKRIPPSFGEMCREGSLQNHRSWPPLPPFARLRIVDHERFVFDGLPNSPEAIKAEVNRYWKTFSTRNETINEMPPCKKDNSDAYVDEPPGDLNQSISKNGLHYKFCKLSGVPFFHPFDPNNPEYGPEYGPQRGPISRIGDLSPAKRMWRIFRSLRKTLSSDKPIDPDTCLNDILEARSAFLDWMDRNHLPSGVEPDPHADFTIMYVNNTIYGESRHGGLRFDEWRTRVKEPTKSNKQPGDLQLSIINADYFLHGYINPDFGGKSGWENQFKPTLPLGGTGSFFSFGRFNWRFNTEPGAIGIPPAVMLKRNAHEDLVDYVHDVGHPTFLSEAGEPIYDGTQPDGVRPFVHRVWIRYNYEPSRRLRFYQFDPLHHDVAIYSIH